MNNAVETADIFRGAYLLCCGARVRRTRLQRRQVVFVIEGDGAAREGYSLAISRLIRVFSNGELGKSPDPKQAEYWQQKRQPVR